MESMGVLSTHCVLHNTGLHIIVEEWEGDVQGGIHMPSGGWLKKRRANKYLGNRSNCQKEARWFSGPLRRESGRIFTGSMRKK